MTTGLPAVPVHVDPTDDVFAAGLAAIRAELAITDPPPPPSAPRTRRRRPGRRSPPPWT